MTTIAYAPASIGNVSVGFDILGAALKPISGERLGDCVSVTVAEQFNVTCSGRFAHKLPADPGQNLVTLCHDFFHDKLGEINVEADTLALHLEKNLPIGSGLGSSASSVVAALDALNQHYGCPFDQTTLLLMMGELEGQVSGSVHYDNVAPAYLGGMVLMTEQSPDVAVTLPVFSHWHWVVCYSGLSVSTAAARDILPTQIALSDTIAFGRQLSVFVHALHSQNESLAAAMLKDVIAEPHRKSLLPKFDQSRDFAMNHGALGFGISGSGPTVFALTDNADDAEVIAQWLEQNYIQNEDGFCHVCQLDEHGATPIKGTK